ncbi:MAG: hypothetical protein JWP91_3686 [Fibrobacteres bacterium]|nr:hypothetical protein [Fibrobacterota bacterium]
MFKVKRVYLPADPEDGFRVLVDRLWPRGLSKSKAHVDLWMKEIAPSDGLRKWFGHDPERWIGFEKRYREELRGKGGEKKSLRGLERDHGTVTLLFGAKDEKRNNAVVLGKAMGR